MMRTHTVQIAGNKRGRSNINMPGVNENVTNELNKKHKGLLNKSGRPNPDFPQNVISTTAIMLPPPQARLDIPEKDMYAPKSNNELANTPSRGDWAYCAVENFDWMGKIVSSGVNTYSNAIPVSTNMGGVPIGTKIRFAGLVGNAGMGKQGDQSADNFGQVYSSGALSGRNTGPEYIPPLSHVYLSPFPYIRTDIKTGKSFPGYTDPGWDAVNCDKYQPATHALRDTDVTQFFQSVENTLKEKATKSDCLNRTKTILSDLGIHPHVPVYAYAKHFLYQARLDFMMKEIGKGKADHDKATMDVANKVVAENKKFWKEVSDAQDKITSAMGCPAWDSRRAESLQQPTVGAYDVNTLLTAYVRLTKESTEIFKQQFAEQSNFIRSLVFGKSRYGSPSEGQLDIMVGYRI